LLTHAISFVWAGEGSNILSETAAITEHIAITVQAACQLKDSTIWDMMIGEIPPAAKIKLCKTPWVNPTRSDGTAITAVVNSRPFQPIAVIPAKKSSGTTIAYCSSTAQSMSKVAPK
jgi:hypothetical protein